MKRPPVPSLLAALQRRAIALLACTGLLNHLLLASLAGASLMAVAPQAQATCVASNSTSPQTYTYTSATIGSSASVDLSFLWRCYQNGSSGTESSSNYTCYMASFGGTAANSSTSTTLPYSVRLYRGTSLNTTATTVANTAASATWYGRFDTLAHGSNYETVRVMVAANASSTALPIGTYTASIGAYIDEQANTGSCEGSTSSWDSGSTTVTANFVVPSFCQLVSNTGLDFGSISTIGTLASAIDATASIVVKCNANAPYTVYLGDGNYRVSSGSGLRRMANGSARIPYQLYKESSRTNVWDATGIGAGATGGSGGISATANGSNQTLTVYGRIPAGQTIPATTGTYSDTVVITVAY
ncbi:MAG: spore coat U domain-containing protein [Pseudoxanthomonas sp.]